MPLSPVFHYGVYIGTNPKLQGHRALCMVTPSDTHEIKIQTDDVSTGYGYGWYTFPSTDWALNPGVLAKPSHPGD